MAIKYEKGQRVGASKIIYISEADKRGGKRRRATLLCHCGNEFDCIIESVRTGNTKSCGCSTVLFRSESNTKHGKAIKGSESQLYKKWCGMKQRCYDKNEPRYKDWGGRGILVCDEWIDDFSSFEKWARNNGYSYGLEIDRRDNNKGYAPSNCRFITRKYNCRNRRVRKGSSTGISGVTFDKKSGKCRSVITVETGKKKSLGYFDDFFQACCARKSAENKYW